MPIAHREKILTPPQYSPLSTVSQLQGERRFSLVEDIYA
jgi:hypothetical protein